MADAEEHGDTVADLPIHPAFGRQLTAGTRASLCVCDGVDNYFDQDFDDDTGSLSESVTSPDPEFDVPDPEKQHKSTSFFKKISFIKWPKHVPLIHHAHHHDRKEILREAAELGETGECKKSGRHIVVLYNPVAGAGVAKKLVDHMVAPVLTLAGCSFEVVATQARAWAIDYMLKLDPAKVQGVLICGGDGLVHEVVTGFMRRPDVDSIDVTLGLVPSGTANAMAHELHAHSSHSHVALVGRAALAAARNHTRRVDVIACSTVSDKPEDTTYALSVFGWGMAGTVAKVADELRWLPGQKRFRYDLAGFVSMMKDWPIVCSGVISYPVGDKGEWEERKFSCSNFTATNLPWLGVDHPMTRDVSPDDGYLVVSWVPSDMQRHNLIEMGMGMKSGKYLFEHKRVKDSTIKVPEFRIKVEEGKKYDMNIDGDPMDASDVHVRVLHQRLTVFAEPKDVVGPLMVKAHKSVMKKAHTPFSPSAPAQLTLEEEANSIEAALWVASV